MFDIWNGNFVEFALDIYHLMQFRLQVPDSILQLMSFGLEYVCCKTHVHISGIIQHKMSANNENFIVNDELITLQWWILGS